jgi:Flp pilus assembly protein TadG
MRKRLCSTLRETFSAAGRLRRDRRGVSAVEFALVLPIMIAMFFGGVEISQAVMADRKVTLVTRTVADLVAQTSTLSTADMSNVLAASSSIAYPFDATRLTVTVSSVVIDGSGNARVAWSCTRNGSVRATNSVVTLPAALAVANSSLILGEATYVYRPVIGYTITGTLTLADKIYLRPRLTNTVTGPPSC